MNKYKQLNKDEFSRADIAFPVAVQFENKEIVTNLGMDLRDYFAAKAMQGIQSSWNYENEGNSVLKPDCVAKRAYLIADAMMKAREQ